MASGSILTSKKIDQPSRNNDKNRLTGLDETATEEDERPSQYKGQKRCTGQIEMTAEKK